MKCKRLISAILSAAMALPMGAGCLTAGAEPGDGTDCVKEYGDVNDDGAISIADLVMFGKWLLGKGEMTAPEAADMNGDRKTDVFDFILLRRRFVETLPEEVLFRVTDLCSGMEAKKVEGLEPDKEFSLSQTGVALDLLRHTADGSSNVLISPYSVVQALAMTANGAKGDTLSEMENVLGGMPIDKLNKYLYTQRTSQPDSEDCKLLTANSIWTRNAPSRIKVNADFLQTNMDYYDADFYVAPFDEFTVKAVNKWVEKNTDGMIKKLTDKLDPENVMLLINAITFDAKWQRPYTKDNVIEDADFTAADGSAQKADYLVSTESYFLKDENATGIMKPYKGGKYAFAALLPDKDVSLGDYIEGLTPERLGKVLSNPDTSGAYTMIPKFSYDYSNELKEILTDMEMGAAFSDAADFSGMNDVDNPLFISSVMHKTFIQLDEEGTRAAAVTEVVMSDKAMLRAENEVVLNRPFLYCIVDTETNIPVFIGTLTSIK